MQTLNMEREPRAKGKPRNPHIEKAGATVRSSLVAAAYTSI